MKVIMLLAALVALTEANSMFVLTRLPRSALPPGAIPADVSAFTADQAGNALSDVRSGSDTRLGTAHSAVRGLVADTGRLRGGANAANRFGDASASHYAGDLQGKGGLTGDTRSLTTPKGSAARTAVLGFISGPSNIHGSTGTGTKGNRYYGTKG